MAGKSFSKMMRDDGFVEGVAIALSIIQSCYDQPRMCAEVLKATNLDRRKMKRVGVDDYDLKILRPVFAELK